MPILLKVNKKLTPLSQKCVEQQGSALKVVLHLSSPKPF